jgi:hypothetical protein
MPDIASALLAALIGGQRPPHDRPSLACVEGPLGAASDQLRGQWLSNQRRPGALAGRPDRAEALAAIAPYWNPCGVSKLAQTL